MSKPSEREVKRFNDFHQVLSQHEPSDTLNDLIYAMQRSGVKAQACFDKWIIQTSREVIRASIPAVQDVRALRPDHRAAAYADLIQQLKATEAAHQKWFELIMVAGDIKKLPQLVRRVERHRRKSQN